MRNAVGLVGTTTKTGARRVSTRFSRDLIKWTGHFTRRRAKPSTDAAYTIGRPCRRFCLGSHFGGAMSDPFTLPEGNVAIAFSGGRTSAMMLHEILRANGGLPDRAVVSFQNTGREMPETLDFVQECGERWGARIVWLEYRPEAPRFEIVSHNSASRNGEPFEALIRKRRMLPNRVARFCTAELKVHAQTRYLRSLGWERWHNARGIRADEPARLPKSDTAAPAAIDDLFGADEPAKDTRKCRERWTPWHPMADAGLSRHDVAVFWRRQPFDLRLPNINGTTPLGNCDGCFLKSEANLAAFARDYPERAAWWRDMEETLSAQIGKSGCAWFNQRRPMVDLIDMVERRGDLIFETEGFLCQASDGECTG